MKYGIQVKTSLEVIEKIQEPSFDLQYKRVQIEHRRRTLSYLCTSMKNFS